MKPETRAGVQGIELESDAELKLAGDLLSDIADRVRRAPNGELGEITLRDANTVYEKVTLDRDRFVPAPYSDALLEALRDSADSWNGPNPELATEMLEGYDRSQPE